MCHLVGDWIKKQWMVCPESGILLNSKKKWAIRSWKDMDETNEHSVQFSRSVVSDSLQPHKPQHTRPPCPSPTPRAYSNSCPLSRWCHPTISSSVILFSSCLQSFPASESFPMSQFFASGGQIVNKWDIIYSPKRSNSLLFGSCFWLSPNLLSSFSHWTLF